MPNFPNIKTRNIILNGVNLTATPASGLMISGIPIMLLFNTGQFVYLTGDQNISGDKVFYDDVTFKQLVNIDVGGADAGALRVVYEGNDIIHYGSTEQYLSNLSSTSFVDLRYSLLWDVNSPTLDWTGRKTYNTSENTTIDWENRRLSGNWSTNTSPTLGHHLVNLSYFDANLPSITSIGNTIFVDKEYGDDNTAERERIDKPFLTLSAACGEAVSGDKIFVSPGIYNSTGNLFKNGISYECYGAEIYYVGHNPSGGLFDDRSEVGSCWVNGGRFFNQNTGVWSSITRLTGEQSYLNMNVEEMDCIGTDATARATFYAGNGTTFIRANKLNATDAAYIGWWGDGECFVEAQQLSGRAEVISALLGDWTHGSLWVKAQQIRGAFTSAHDVSNILGGQSEARMWVEADQISHTNINLAGGKWYFTAKKISNGADFSNVINLQAGQLWLNTQKLTNTGYYSHVALSSGESWLNIEHFESGGDNADNGMEINGGTHNITVKDFQRLKTGHGIYIYDSPVVKFNGQITTQGSGTYPIVKNGGTLALYGNTVLVSNSTGNCIYSATPQTVKIYGNVMANTNKHSNVTFSPIGMFTVDSAVS